MSPDRVEPLKAEFSDVIATFEKLGRDSAKILAEPSTVKGGRGKARYHGRGE